MLYRYNLTFSESCYNQQITTWYHTMMITQAPESPSNTLADISEEIIFPPSDLYSDEPPVETELHL